MNTSIILAISTPIGVILGSIITLIGNNINNKAQRKREKETFQRDISFKKEKRQYEQNQIRINAIIEIIELLSYFEYSISLTSSCIDTTKKLSVTEHDNAYKKELIKIHRLVSLICVYTPYYNYIRTIEGSHSVYWGRQRTLLLIEYEEDKERYNNVLTTVVQTAQECSKNISNLIYELRKLSESLLPSI